MQLDKGVTEEERYWHGWPWALCWALFACICLTAARSWQQGEWFQVGFYLLVNFFILGLTANVKKKFYLRRRNMQARREVKF